jgi:hypothetical protein
MTPTYDELLARSAALPYTLPTTDNRVERFADRRQEVEEHAAGVRPILHGDGIPLIDVFLALKQEVGSPAEQALYTGMNRAAFVSRLLTKRPLAFLGGGDSYLLRSGERGAGGFESVGGPDERPPLTLQNLLSYDEMAISALLGVSVPTHFINAGSRGNEARCGEPNSFEPRGIYVGLVGARFERPEVMEWRHLLVTEDQNTPAKGYGPTADPDAPATRLLRAWARFYGRETLPTFAEAKADTSERYLPYGRGGLFDTQAFKARLRVSVEAYLRDADERAREEGRPAYVHAVGLGLGVWKIHPRQAALSVEVYADVLRERRLIHLADLDFSWFGDPADCGGVADGELFRAGDNEVRIHFSKRDPAAKLTGDDAGKLLVAMYAWDSNAFPGNEYWLRQLSASGDPAAACCSTIPQLQNPDVNPRVSGDHALVFPAGQEPRPL